MLGSRLLALGNCYGLELKARTSQAEAGPVPPASCPLALIADSRKGQLGGRLQSPGCWARIVNTWAYKTRLQGSVFSRGKSMQM